MYVTKAFRDEALVVLHVHGSSGTQHEVNIWLQSESERSLLFHTVTFYKLAQHAFSGFDRWVQDLQSGNYSALKTRYARGWAAASWEEYTATQPSGGSREAPDWQLAPPQDARDRGRPMHADLQEVVARASRASDEWDDSSSGEE